LWSETHNQKKKGPASPKRVEGEPFSGRFKDKSGKSTIAPTVKDILDEQITHKLA
jgi:hypothetical protein